MITPKNIMEDAWCYMKSRVLFTAAELDLFTKLEGCHYTAAELARDGGWDERGTTRLLDCLAAMDLLQKEQGRYRLSEGSAVLSAKHPATILPMILHLNHIWKNWSQLTETVRQGKNEGLRKIGDWGGEVQEAFIGAMHVIGQELAAEIAAAYDLSPYKKLLDIGGASGTYTMAFLRQNPAMRAVFSILRRCWPWPKKGSRQKVFLDRVELAAGDFYQDELPGDATWPFVGHQFIRTARNRMSSYIKDSSSPGPGGVVLIRDHIMDESRTQPPAGAMFALNMLVNTTGGDTYTFVEVKETLEAAGFGEVKQVRAGERMDCLVEGEKPLRR